jgi:putative membrane protein
MCQQVIDIMSMACSLNEYVYKIFFMKNLICGIYMIAVISVISACNNSSTSEKKDSVDSANAVNKEVKAVDQASSKFAVNAADGGMMEVAVGKLASEKAVSKRIRAFGQMMVKDHSEANDKLKGIASSLNIALPDSLSDDSKKELDNLSKKTGKDFDKAYMDMMVDDHKKDVAEFRKAADNLSDSTIKSFAESTLPVLEKHLDSAQSIVAKK